MFETTFGNCMLLHSWIGASAEACLCRRGPGLAPHPLPGQTNVTMMIARDTSYSSGPSAKLSVTGSLPYGSHDTAHLDGNAANSAAVRYSRESGDKTRLRA